MRTYSPAQSISCIKRDCFTRKPSQLNSTKVLAFLELISKRLGENRGREYNTKLIEKAERVLEEKLKELFPCNSPEPHVAISYLKVLKDRAIKSEGEL